MSEIESEPTGTPAPGGASPVLHEIISVSATQQAEVFLVECDITDIMGSRYVTKDYVSTPSDTFGLAPSIRAGVAQWIAANNAVAPFMPPTDERRRQAMPALTPRQLRLGLVNYGFSVAAVQSAIDAISDPTIREKTQIEWEFANSYGRLHPLIAQIAAALSIPDEQIDMMWVAAASL